MDPLRGGHTGATGDQPQRQLLTDHRVLDQLEAKIELIKSLTRGIKMQHDAAIGCGRRQQQIAIDQPLHTSQRRIQLATDAACLGAVLGQPVQLGVVLIGH